MIPLHLRNNNIPNSVMLLWYCMSFSRLDLTEIQAASLAVCLIWLHAKSPGPLIQMGWSSRHGARA